MGDNRNWGGSPQKSDTSAAQRPKWGDAPQKSDTTAGPGRPQWGTGGPQKSDTQFANQSTRSIETPEYNFYLPGNVTYKTVRLLHSESGEAKIFEIEAGDKHYALKLYRHGIHPDHAILDKVMKLRGSGLLVDIHDHGTWHDDVLNADFDYEVMQLCTGGSLASLQLNGKEEELKNIALRMTAAIDFLHKNGILHRDVKPANFMFTDKSQQNFVLTDWGFARLLDSNGKAVSDDGRTKIYTAPELYIHIPGQKTFVDAKADFYSLGMSILALWKGEGMLIANEEELVRRKLDEELPYPSRKEMSEHTLSLIKALTRNNPDKRAGFEEVKRWAKGEIIFKDAESDNLVKDYRIVFSGEKNLIAHNNAELAQIMWHNKSLAQKYLYNDKIADWLEGADRPEMAVRMREITEMEYPSRQDAGLYAACLELDPDMPFYGVKGKEIRTQQELAAELYYYPDDYQDAIGVDEHPLWVYCRSVGLDEEIKEITKKGVQKGYSYLWELAFKLDTTLGFPVPVFNGDKNVPVVARNLKEYADAFYSSEKKNFYYQTRRDFLQWLHNVDPAMRGRAQTFLNNDYYQKKEINLNALVHYAILPDYGFDGLPLDKSQMATPEQIAEDMIAKLALFVEGKPGIGNIGMDGFYSSYLYPYLLTKEKYQKQLSWVKYCLDYRSDDNQKKSGPYNPEIATLKILAGWHGGSIPITIEGKTFHTSEDGANAYTSRLSEDEQTLLANWLTLKFQEDPQADYKAKSYTKRTLEYYQFLEKHLSNCEYIANANGPDIEDVAENNRRTWKRVRFIRSFAVIFCFLPMLCVCGIMGYMTVTSGSETIVMLTKGLGYGLAILVGIIGAICCADGGLIGMAVGGFICFWLVQLLFNFMAPVMPWAIIAILLGGIIYFGRKIFFKLRHKLATGSSLSWEETMLRYRAGTAFGTLNKLMPNFSFSSLEEAIDDNTAEAKKKIPGLVKSTVMMLLITIGGVLLCTIGANKLQSGLPVEEQTMAGIYTGDVQGTPSTITLSENAEGLLQADMVINYRAGVTKQTMVAKEKTELPITLYLEGNDKIKLTLKDNVSADGTRSLEGTYINSKGNSRKVNYTETKE